MRLLELHVYRNIGHPALDRIQVVGVDDGLLPVSRWTLERDVNEHDTHLVLRVPASLVHITDQPEPGAEQ